jgi:hypothetical protein
MNLNHGTDFISGLLLPTLVSHADPGEELLPARDSDFLICLICLIHQLLIRISDFSGLVSLTIDSAF